MISAIFGIGGGAGLIGGGLIADNLSYHWIFWVGAISASLAALATYTWVPESPVRVPGRIDVPGALLLAVGLALPLLAISRANAWGWGVAADARPDRRRPRRARRSGSRWSARPTSRSPTSRRCWTRPWR